MRLWRGYRKSFPGFMIPFGSHAIFDGAHQLDDLGAELVHELLALSHADTVLAGAGPAHRVRARDHRVVDAVHAIALGGVRRIEQEDHVEVAVADVADDGREQPFAIDVGARRFDGLGQGGNRHADVGDDGDAAGLERECRKVSGVPRLPELRAVFLARCPGEGLPAVVGSDLLRALGLLCDARDRAVELEKERRQFVECQLRVHVAGPDLHFVQEFHARHRRAELQELGNGVDRAAQRRKCACRGPDFLRVAAQAQRDLADDAERAFGAGQEAHQVVAG